MMTRSAHSRSLTGGFQRSPRGYAPAGLAAKGRRGDTMLAHVTPEEAALLKARGGSGTVNPQTGLREFWQGEGDTDYGGGAGVSAGDNYGGNAGGGYGGYSGGSAGEAASAGGFYPGLNPELGPGAMAGREFIERAQPSPMQNAVAWGIGAALPFGIDARAVPDYMAGKPALELSVAPMQTLANLSPIGPLGDMMAPSWGETTFASVPFGEAQHDPHTGRGRDDAGGFERDPSQQPDWRAMADQLVRSVVRAPEPTQAAPATTAGRAYSPFTGDATRYGQPGGAAGHRFFV